MRKETTITLSVEDKDAILHVARIMEELSNDGRCWTSRDLRALADKDIEKSAADMHKNINFEW